MIKWTYWAAVIAFALIPVVFIGGMGAAAMINPEWALGTAHYARNFRLLQDARMLLMLAAVGASGLLWLSVFILALMSKGRSLKWAALAVLGPFGLLALALLDDAAPTSADAHARWSAGRGFWFRLLSETAFFVAAWVVSYQAVVLWRNVQILAQSIVTGESVAQIIAVQAASSGMWAFSEGLKLLFFMALLYMARPVCFNLAARWRSAPREN